MKLFKMCFILFVALNLSLPLAYSHHQKENRLSFTEHLMEHVHQDVADAGVSESEDLLATQSMTYLAKSSDGEYHAEAVLFTPVQK